MFVWTFYALVQSQGKAELVPVLEFKSHMAPLAEVGGLIGPLWDEFGDTYMVNPSAFAYYKAVNVQQAAASAPAEPPAGAASQG